MSAAGVHPARLAWRAMWGRAYPRIIGSNRDRSWLFYDTVLPLLGTIAFVYVYITLEAPDRYIGYVIMAGATTAFWLNVLWGLGAQLYWEKTSGNLEIFMSAPCGMVPILLGMSVGGLIATTVRAVAVVLMGVLLFDVRFTLAQPLVFVAIFVVALASLYALGMAFASLFLMWGREAWHIVNLFMEPVFLVSGFYFPVAALGFWVALGASVIPLTLALDAMRQLMFGADHPGFLSVPVELAILVLLTVGYALLARWALARMEDRARRDGRLSLRY